MSDATRAWFYLNTMVLRVSRLRNELTGAYVAAGVVVTAQLYDHANGAAISGASATLTYQGESGVWAGVFASDVAVTLDQMLRVVLTIDGGTAQSRGRLRVLAQVEEREVA